MKNILFLECASGISGDMTVAALLDLGADRQVLLDALHSLPLTGYSVEITEVFKSGIRACDFNVLLEADNHDHDMAYLHGTAHSEHSHDHTHEHSHEHEHAHEHTHEHTRNHSHNHMHEHTHEHSHEHAHGHHHDARNLHDITEIINASQMTETAKNIALRIFGILAEAEAYVHGKTVSEIHFHEVGAVDSIVDIAAAAICIDNLAPDQVIVSPLTDGTGQIRCQHGIIPVPVPAVTAIAMQNGLVLKSTPIEGELVTPTGAAIAAAFASEETLPAEYKIKEMGFGAGKRNYPTTGLLRAMMLQTTDHDAADSVYCLETNIDDSTGEAISYTMQKLFDEGALDVFCIPIYMKKNRPATLLKVICRPEQVELMEQIIFCNTTTIGIRRQMMERTKLPRQIVAVETPWGMADVKCCKFGDDVYYYPENDSVTKLAAENNLGFTEMYHCIKKSAAETIPAIAKRIE